MLWPVWSWYSAAPLHGAQADPGDALTVPFAQGSQADTSVEPERLAFPAGQRSQLSVCRPSTALYRPLWHSLHCACPDWSWYCPAPHAKQVASVVLAKGKCLPAAHATHCWLDAVTGVYDALAPTPSFQCAAQSPPLSTLQPVGTSVHEPVTSPSRVATTFAPCLATAAARQDDATGSGVAGVDS